jgi:phosphoribosyl-ATP pyrophosphohydrolase/phosphoribosyl-AMP cyclohydrolase
VKQNGVACHTGRRSCFFTELESGESVHDVEINTQEAYGVIDTLYHTIQERKNADPQTSWTAKLLSKGENTILKKVVEEAGEYCFAHKDDDEDEMVYEAADLTYHMLVALASKNISPDRIKQELARRFGMSGIPWRHGSCLHALGRTKRAERKGTQSITANADHISSR